MLVSLVGGFRSNSHVPLWMSNQNQPWNAQPNMAKTQTSGSYVVVGNRNTFDGDHLHSYSNSLSRNNIDGEGLRVIRNKNFIDKEKSGAYSSSGIHNDLFRDSELVFRGAELGERGSGVDNRIFMDAELNQGSYIRKPSYINPGRLNGGSSSDSSSSSSESDEYRGPSFRVGPNSYQGRPTIRGWSDDQSKKSSKPGVHPHFGPTLSWESTSKITHFGPDISIVERGRLNHPSYRIYYSELKPFIVYITSQTHIKI